jgi:glycosyltransferase involved in cell wall biosynthesis
VKTPPRPVRVLLDLHPALEGHAGIPQETRLLFRGLSMIEGLDVEGLIQSSSHALGRGIPPRETGGRLSTDRQINRLARVVIMLEQKFLRTYFSALPMVLRRLCGAAEELTRFEAEHFRDFIWRRLFARSLHASDFDTVTRARYRVARLPWNTMHAFGFVTGPMGYALYPRVSTGAFDVLIAETPYPGTVSPHTRLVVRYHDAFPLLMPHTISNRHHHQASHYRALRHNVESGAWFVCASEATRRDLLSVFPRAEARSVTIHNMVSHDYFDEDSDPRRVPEIIKSRRSARILREGGMRRGPSAEIPSGELQYLLIVSTIEPRKNHLTLLSAWEQLRVERFPGLKLLVVGALGWHQKKIVAKFRPWIDRGEVFILEDVPAAELRLLYKHARATVCPSFGEGFGFSGVEAMISGGAVVASDLPVHREVYGQAAELFNPYSAADLVRALIAVIDPAHANRRAQLMVTGAEVARRYACEPILSKWQDFLTARAQVTDTSCRTSARVQDQRDGLEQQY